MIYSIYDSTKASDLFVTADVEPSMKINGQIVPVAKTKLKVRSLDN
jgi:Tfp pilus assembly ATPase PilU